MKRFITPLIISGSLAIVPSAGNAQTSVQIQNIWAYDSLTNFCQTPSEVWFSYYGFATGYTVGDSVTIEFFYGDGTDTTLKAPVPQTFYGNLMHTYTVQGAYTIQMIATGPDGKADTMVLPNLIVISDTCGTISGHVFNDVNGNCVQDSGEADLPGIPVHLIYSGSVIMTHWTDASGNYYFSAGLSNAYDIEIADLSSYGFGIVCPGSGTYTSVTPPSSGNDFAIQCLSDFDLHGSFWAWRFRPGFAAWGNMCVWNSRCQPVSGTVTVVINNPNVSYVSATPTPSSVNGDTLTWNFSNLNNANYWYNYHGFCANIEFYTSPNAQLGDTVCFDWWVEPTAGDADTTNNSGYFCTTVRNSWDPNAKDVNPQGTGNNGGVLANTPMQYFVQFQNTGNDVAFNVHIVDTIDTDLDMSTLQIVETSHPMTLVVNANVVQFNFNNIMLPDSNSDEPGSHGYVVYNISQKLDLSLGTEIENTARIYFDFNPAIVTNTVLNTIVDPTGMEVPVSAFASIHPNPASDFLRIELNEETADMTLYDMAGRIIVQRSLIQGVNLIDLRGVPSGVFSVVLQSEQGRMQKTVVVSR